MRRPGVARDDYLQRLIAAGYRVAVCEQLEDPAEAKKRGSKSVVRRDVVRLVTPGTITEEALLPPRRAINSRLRAAERGRRGGCLRAGCGGHFNRAVLDSAAVLLRASGGNCPHRAQ